MKLLKTGFLILVLSVFSVNITIAQDAQPTMFTVHTDNVKFDMMPQYEKVAKEMKDNFTKHNIQDASWTAISIEDGRYVYVTPIENMAELDDNSGFTELSEKMGKEEAAAMFDKMNECYDSHSNSISHYKPELSYSAEGVSNKDKNYREYHFLYYAPRHGKAMKEAMKNVKALFESKGIKNSYSVFHSGFGSDESYYMVSVAGKDDVEIALGGQENDKAFGEEGKATFFEVIKLTSRYDQVEGRIRPDLSYYPSKE